MNAAAGSSGPLSFVVFVAGVFLGNSVLGQVSFRHEIVDAQPPDRPYIKLAGDFDGDGKPDIAIGGAKGPLVWYVNPSWKKITIAEGGWQTVGGAVADMDGDGDLDIVPGSQVWFENPRPGGDPTKDRWSEHRIGRVRSHDVLVADLDGDGRPDIVSRDQSAFGRNAGNKIYLWRQVEPDRWERVVLDCEHGEGLALADLDRDGDVDIVIGGVWLENPGQIASHWARHVYTTSWSWPHTKVATGDLNNDGRTDIVLAPAEYKGQSYRIAWYEAPPDPRLSDWKEHVVVPRVESVIHSLRVADFDLDGLTDIAFAHMHQGQAPQKVGVFINRGNSGWKEIVVSRRGSHDIVVEDFNCDGRPDILGANHGGPYHPVELWINCGSD